MNYTENYGLTKDGRDENYNVGRVNANWDKVDAKIKEIEDSDNSKEPKITKGNGFLKYINSAWSWLEKITNSDLSSVDSGTFKGRISDDSGNVEDLTTSQMKSYLGINDKLDILKSITGFKINKDTQLFYLDSSTTAGALKITLPQRKTGCSYSFDLEIFNTVNNKNTKLQINGFNRSEGCNYDDSTYTASAYHKVFLLSGEYAPPVAFYTGEADDYILIGGITDSFANCRIAINNKKISNISEDWNNFSISLFTVLESLNSTQFLAKNVINANTEIINFTSASGIGSAGVVIPSGLPVGTKKLIRKVNSTQGTVEISCSGETLTKSGISTLMLNRDGDYWLIEKILKSDGTTRWEVLEGRCTGTNNYGDWIMNADGSQVVTGRQVCTAQTQMITFAKNIGTVRNISYSFYSSSGIYPSTSHYSVGTPAGTSGYIQFNSIPSSPVTVVFEVRGEWY